MSNWARAEREFELRREEQASGEQDALDIKCCPECEGNPVDEDGEVFECFTCRGRGFVEIPKMTRKEYLTILAENYGSNDV